MWSSIQWTDLPYVYKYIRLREILRHYSKFKFWHFTWVCNRSVCVNILAVISECFLMCLNLSRGFWHRCRSSNVFTQTTFSDWPDHFLMVGRCVWIYQGALLIALWSCNRFKLSICKVLLQRKRSRGGRKWLPAGLSVVCVCQLIWSYSTDMLRQERN